MCAVGHLLPDPGLLCKQCAKARLDVSLMSSIVDCLLDLKAGLLNMRNPFQLHVSVAWLLELKLGSFRAHLSLRA